MSILVPMVIERTPEGERAMDIQSRLLRDRIIMLTDQVNQQTATSIVAQMLYLEAENPNKDILFYINSPGGSVTAGLSIYDTMQFIRCDVSTVVMGQAASMGSFLAQAGTPGKRFIMPSARHMVHQPSGGYEGQATDIVIHAEEIVKLKRYLTGIYVAHNSAGKKYAQIETDMERDRFMSAEESVEYGLADEVITKRI